MDDQEMQFADPAWRPSQQLTGAQPDRQDNFPPINDYAQPQERIIPPSQDEKIHSGGRSYESGYRGSNRYADFSGQHMASARPRQHGRRGPWSWLLLAIFIIVLIGGLSRAGLSIPAPSFSAYPQFDNRGQGFDHNRAPFDRNSQTFKVGTTLPTVNINDPVGSVTVQADPHANEVTIQSNGSQDGNPGDPNSQQVNAVQSTDGNTITVTVNGDANSDPAPNGVDLLVTVPSTADLNLTTSGDITVDGISGQLTLQTDAGAINLSQAALSGESSLITGSGAIDVQETTLSGQSTLKSDSGDVTFNGSLTPQGTYQFGSNTGAVDITLPTNTSFSTNASTNGGTITSDFTQVIIRKPDSNSTIASGNVGNSPYANLNITTESGSIALHQG